MSNVIRTACLEVAKTNMWDNKLTDAAPMIAFIGSMSAVGVEAVHNYRNLGASEQDVADAIHYIAQVYALPPIRDDIRWFKEVLDTLLQIAFPNGGVGDEGARFAKRLITGIQEQLTE